MKTTFAVMLLLNASQAQQTADVLNAAQQVLGGSYSDALNSATKPITEALEPYKVYNSTHERGVPQVHDDLGKFQISLRLTTFEIDCEKTPSDPQCLHEVLKDKEIQGAGHHVRAKTNTPIIGIMTQPVPTSAQGHHSMWENQFDNYKDQEFKNYLDDTTIDKDEARVRDDIFPQKQFIENTHVKFLESAGARIVPIDYTLSEDALQKVLD